MCFISAKRPKIMTAKKDILCWKELRKDYRPINYYRCPPYECNKLVKAKEYGEEIKKLKVIRDGDKYKVFAGIHSYTEKYVKMYFPNFLSSYVILVPFVIPKGTKYITDGYFNVSVSIMRIKKSQVKKYQGRKNK